MLDVRGPAVQAGPVRFALERGPEAELGGDRHAPAEGNERLAQELFVRERAVDLGGVEECDAAFDRRADQRDHLLLVRRRTVAKAHSHAAEADGRDLEIALSQRSLLHRLSSWSAPQASRPSRSSNEGE